MAIDGPRDHSQMLSVPSFAPLRTNMLPGISATHFTPAHCALCQGSISPGEDIKPPTARKDSRAETTSLTHRRDRDTGVLRVLQVQLTECQSTSRPVNDTAVFGRDCNIGDSGVRPDSLDDPLITCLPSGDTATHVGKSTVPEFSRVASQLLLSKSQTFRCDPPVMVRLPSGSHSQTVDRSACLGIDQWGMFFHNPAGAGLMKVGRQIPDLQGGVICDDSTTAVRCH
eukprot:scaffold57515_cov18-Prasinocladus_malaysianus.AAC.2